jgi:hypothetical protein
LFRAGRYTEALDRWDTAGGVIARPDSEAGIAEMVSTWMRLRDGAPDPHTQAAGLLMLAATNEMVERINHVTQAARAGEGQLGTGREFALPGGRSVTFRVGDQVLLRINDRHHDAVTGEAVLNGYRGVVTKVSRRGVTVEWHQPGDAPGQGPHRTRCLPDYIAEGGLQLGYAMTGHKAEGLTVDGRWQRPDGSVNRGSVLVWGPGMDNPGLYVAMSRDRGEVRMFSSLEALEGEREQLLYGTPADQTALTDRAKAGLAERAKTTENTANDRPVQVDLGHEPDQTHRPNPSPPQQTTETAQPPEAVMAEEFTRADPAEQERLRALLAKISARNGAGTGGAKEPGEGTGADTAGRAENEVFGQDWDLAQDPDLDEDHSTSQRHRHGHGQGHRPGSGSGMSH